MSDDLTFKGTPGPWKILHGGFRHDDGFSIGSSNSAASHVKVTCECWPCTIIDQQHRDELLANANLIQAAPDLLAALLVTTEWMQWWLTEDMCECEDGHVCGKKQRQAELDAARAAINTALGVSKQGPASETKGGDA